METVEYDELEVMEVAVDEQEFLLQEELDRTR